MATELTRLTLEPVVPSFDVLGHNFPHSRALLIRYFRQMDQLNASPSSIMERVNLIYKPECSSGHPAAVFMHATMSFAKLGLSQETSLVSDQLSGQAVKNGFRIGMANLMQLLLEMSQNRVDWEEPKPIDQTSKSPGLQAMVEGRFDKRAEVVYRPKYKDLVLKSQQKIGLWTEEIYKGLEPGSRINTSVRLTNRNITGEDADIRLAYNVWMTSRGALTDLTRLLFPGNSCRIFWATSDNNAAIKMQQDLMQGLRIENLYMSRDQYRKMFLTTKSSDTPSTTDRRLWLDDGGSEPQVPS